MKRGGTVGLFPFPRVGRSDPELSNWEPATAALLNSLEDYNGILLDLNKCIGRFFIVYSNVVFYSVLPCQTSIVLRPSDRD